MAAVALACVEKVKQVRTDWCEYVVLTVVNENISLIMAAKRVAIIICEVLVPIDPHPRLIGDTEKLTPIGHTDVHMEIRGSRITILRKNGTITSISWAMVLVAVHP